MQSENLSKSKGKWTDKSCIFLNSDGSSQSRLVYQNLDLRER